MGISFCFATLIALAWLGLCNAVGGAKPFAWPSNDEPLSLNAARSEPQFRDTLKEDVAFWDRLLSAELESISMSAPQPTAANVCFMLYQMADNNLEYFLRTDFEELTNSKAIRRSHLTTWVYFDALNDGDPDPLPNVWEKDGSELISTKEKGSRYLTYSHTLKKMIADTSLQGERDSDDPKTVTDFVKYALTDCVARNATEYFIAFSDHGGGYTGFGGDWNTRRVQTHDRPSHRHLAQTNSELLSALHQALADVQGAPDVFDVIGFDACLMMAFGALDEFDANITKYVLASEDLEPGAGWDYESLTFASSALGMAKEFHESYLEYGPTMAIIDTVKYKVFVDSLEASSAKLKELLDANNDPELSSAVKRARTQMLGVFYDEYMDMGSFFSELEQLCEPVAGSELETLLSSTRSTYKDMYVRQGVGPYAPDFTGLNVLFYSRDQYNQCPECYDYTLFENPDTATLSAPNWLAFLKSFYTTSTPSSGGTSACTKLQGAFEIGAGSVPDDPPSAPGPNFLLYNETLYTTEAGVSVETSVSLQADEVTAVNGLKISLDGADRRGLRGGFEHLDTSTGSRRAQEEAPFFLYGGVMPSEFNEDSFTAVWDTGFYIIGDGDLTSLLYVTDPGSGRTKRAAVAYFPPGTLNDDKSEGLLGTPVEEVVSLGGTLAEISFVSMPGSQEMDFSLFGFIGTTVSEILPSSGGKIVPILHVGQFPYNEVLGGIENVIFDWRPGHGIKILKVPARQYAEQISAKFGETSVVVSLSAFDHDIYDPNDEEDAIGLQEIVFTLTDLPEELPPDEESSESAEGDSPEESPEE